jgi:hypothetical protein
VRAQAKLDRFRATWDTEREAMERSLVEAVEAAQAQAADAELRAEQAERALVEAGLVAGGSSNDVAARAGVASGLGGA